MNDLLIIIKSSFEHFDVRARSWHELTLVLEGLPNSICKPIKISWIFPADGLKLNTDGSSRGNPGPASGGGILRDSSGSVIFAFSEYFDIKTNLQAEALALLLGLSICHQLNLNNITVECDSAPLIQMSLGKASVPWKLKVIFKKIARYKFRTKEFLHCYRQANTVADALANLAYS